MLKEFDLQGKVAIVIGAGRGIGQGIALVLAEAGVDVVVAELDKSGMEDTWPFAHSSRALSTS
jgi:NAD(P)-dependent dehydrogenase (short-subunit alcohol dehydrogenase family)